MIRNQNSEQFLHQLSTLYPKAFKGNFVLYGQIKTKGILDELKELLPWGLALMIFGSFCITFAKWIESAFTSFDAFHAYATSALGISLFFMLMCPLIIKQMKHSSISLYQQHQHTPLKLTALIILQALNLAFAQSWLLMGIFFFFCMSFGFVKFYKENMFRSQATTLHYHELQQVRRICFWSYKQIKWRQFKLFFCAQHSEHHQILSTQCKEFTDLYLQLIQLENKLCKTYKHQDIEHYLDSIM